MIDTSNEVIEKIVMPTRVGPSHYPIPELRDMIEALAAERDALRATVDDMLEVLRNLSSDVEGLSAFEHAVRQAIGNTNYAVIMEFNGNARAVLAKHKETEQ